MGYFLIQLFEKKTQINRRMPKIVGYIATMIIVIIGWTIFKATNISNAIMFLKCMVGFGDGLFDANTAMYAKNTCVLFLISYFGTFPIARQISSINNLRIRKLIEILQPLTMVMLLGICILIILNGSYSPFIYFNF